MTPTSERLAAALAAAKAPEDMVGRARDGYYDDFKSPLATPLRQLVADARHAGLFTLADRAIAGDFDATAEEADEWFRREGRDLLR